MSQYPVKQPISIDQDFAQAIGLQLKLVREEKGLSLEAVSKALVFSANQVRGIEAADPSSFYGLRIFVMAIKKYAAYLDISISQDQLINNGNYLFYAKEEDIAPRHGLSCVPNKKLKTRKNIPKIAIFLVPGFLATFLFVMIDTNAMASRFKNTATVDVEIEKKTTPIDLNITKLTKSSVDQVSINFYGNSWVRIEFINGKVLERIYTKNESEIIDPEQIRNITIGNAPATSIMLNDQKIDSEILKEKTKGVVVKLTGDNLKSILLESKT